MPSVGLVIIFNHQYNAVIPRLESLYRSKFSNIHYIVPFYQGLREDVIPVYESSFEFEGYIAQAYATLKKYDYDHYFFIADDMVLNPLVNENNFHQHLKLDVGDCFIPGFLSLRGRKPHWPRARDAWEYRIDPPGVEAAKFLPDFETARRKIERFGVEVMPLAYRDIWATPHSISDIARTFVHDPWYFLRAPLSLLSGRSYKLRYPLVGSYSDIFAVSKQIMPLFTHYCGIFAATGLHVELAIPTAMALAADKVQTEANLTLQGESLWLPQKTIREKLLKLPRPEPELLKRYNRNLTQLLDEFPPQRLYLHPIKLTQWH